MQINYFFKLSCITNLQHLVFLTKFYLQPRSGSSIWLRPWPLCLAILFFSFGAAGSELEDHEIAGLIFEESLFHYYKKNYLEAAFQFHEIINKYPDYDNKGPAIKYYISSLSHLEKDKNILEFFKAYSDDFNKDLYFSAIENMQMRGKHSSAFEFLDYISEKNLSQKEKDLFNYLNAVSFSSIDKDKEASINIHAISKNSKYYLFGAILKSQLLFKKRQYKDAINNLEATLKEKELNNANSLAHDKINILAGQISFEVANYSEAIRYFNRITEGKLYFEALSGLHWSYLKNSDFLKAAEVLKISKETFEKKFHQEGLLLNLAFSYFYAEDFKNSIKYFKELVGYNKRVKDFMYNILKDDRLCADYFNYIINQHLGIVIKPVTQLKQFQKLQYEPIKMNPEILKTARKYALVKQFSKELNRTSYLYGNNQEYFKQRYDFFYEFVNAFGQLKNDYSRYKQIIMGVELPDISSTRKSVYFLDEQFEKHLTDYTEKYGRPLTKLEEKLIKILVYVEYISQFSFIDKTRVFRSGLEMVDNLKNLFSEEGTKRLNHTNKAYEHSKESVAMLEKITLFNDLRKKSQKIHDSLIKKVLKYFRKDALRVITNIELNQPQVEIAIQEAKEKLDLNPN